MVRTLKADDRIRLIAMPDDPDPIPAGTLGTVLQVTDHGDWQQVDVEWDSGRSLMLVVPPDRFEIVLGGDRSKNGRVD